MALEAEFEEFVALALDVLRREVNLCLAVRRRNHVGWLVDTALELAFCFVSCKVRL